VVYSTGSLADAVQYGPRRSRRFFQGRKKLAVEPAERLQGGMEAKAASVARRDADRLVVDFYDVSVAHSLASLRPAVIDLLMQYFGRVAAV
jgi:hypothetical protein